LGGDASQTQITIMSNLPTIKIPPSTFDAKASFDVLLQRIHKHHKPSTKADVGPHLRDFLDDPIIKSILADSKDPADLPEPPLHQVDLSGIHTSLSALTKAVSDIQKKVSSHSRKNPQDPPATKRGKGNASSNIKLYSTAVGSRPPNPSLVVDLAQLELTTEGRPRPEEICELLNRELGEITPTQARLAAIRWTAKGNLIVTGAHTATPTSLQAAAPHIGNILSRATAGI
jgi:hypothetical protein